MLKGLIYGNTLNIAIAVVMVIMTLLVMRMIYYMVFIKDKRSQEKDEPTPKKKRKEFNHCELNDIMGYDFIQIKTIPKENEKTKEENERPRSFADSKGIGMTTERIVGTTGRDSYTINDEPIPDKQTREIEKQNEELAQKAREEGMTEISNDQMAAIYSFGDGEWADNTQIETDRDEMMNRMLENIPPEDFANGFDEENVPEPEELRMEESLAEKPQEPEKYDDIMEQSYEMQEKMMSEMEDIVATEAPKELAEQIRSINKIGSKYDTPKPSDEGAIEPIKFEFNDEFYPEDYANVIIKKFRREGTIENFSFEK